MLLQIIEYGHAHLLIPFGSEVDAIITNQETQVAGGFNMGTDINQRHLKIFCKVFQLAIIHPMPMFNTSDMGNEMPIECPNLSAMICNTWQGPKVGELKGKVLHACPEPA